MQIQSDALLAAACAQTGLEDFGGDTFREGLAVFCESASSEAQLNAMGSLAAAGMILGCLANRLKVTDWVKRHPEVAARADRGAAGRGRHVPGRDHLPDLPHGEGPAAPSAAALGGRRQRAAADAGNACHRSAHRGRAHGDGDAGPDQPARAHGAERGARRPHRVHRRPQPGLQEPGVGGAGQRALVRQVAAGDRPSLPPMPGTAACCRCCRAAACAGAGR